MSAVAHRYANAFASVAAANGLDSATAQQQLASFNDTLAESRALREVLSNPAFASVEKLRVLDAIAARLALSPQVRNFIAVIIDNQRLNEFPEIVSQYHILSDEQSGFAEAEITSARPLDAQSRAELEAQVAKLAGNKVRATYIEDPSILGGAIVRIESTVYDGSIRAQLLGLKQKLVSA